MHTQTHSSPACALECSAAISRRREATSHRTLQLMGDLIDKASIPTRELEVVPKSHDDAHLRPPDLSLGERPCCLGERCICVWMARWRYGDHTDLAFVGTEFLLPSQRAAFEAEGVRALPPTPGKCLVCSRYMHVRRRPCARARVARGRESSPRQPCGGRARTGCVRSGCARGSWTKT